jgi:hypothetical protein
MTPIPPVRGAAVRGCGARLRIGFFASGYPAANFTTRARMASVT